MPDETVRIEGWKEFSSELKSAGKEWGRALTRTSKAMAAPIRSAAISRAQALGGVAAAAAGAIKAYANQNSLGVGVPRSSPGYPMATVAFWGSDKHDGWYADAQYGSSTGRQHPRWVGDQWVTGVHGQGPRAINDAVADNADGFVNRWATEMDALLAKAFPNK